MDNDNLLFISELDSINNSGLVINVFMDLNTYEKYLFVKEGDKYIPFEDKKLSMALNSNDFAGYIFNNGRFKQTLKDCSEVTIIPLILAIVISTQVAFHQEALQKLPVKIYNMFSTTFNVSEENVDFVKSFRYAMREHINKLSCFTDNEKDTLINSFDAFLDDFGYLLTQKAADKILERIDTLYVTKRKTLNTNVLASYWRDWNEIVYPSNNIDHLFHELLHLYFNYNSKSYGSAIEEGLIASICDYYNIDKSGYTLQKLDALKISLLIGRDNLIKDYSLGFDIVDDIVANCNCTRKEALRYLAMLDTRKNLIVYGGDLGYVLSTTFEKQGNELYGKLYKGKYGVDFIGGIDYDSSLFDNNLLLKIDRKTYYVPKEVYTSVSSVEEIENAHYNDDNNELLSHIYELTLLLANEEERKDARLSKLGLFNYDFINKLREKYSSYGFDDYFSNFSIMNVDNYYELLAINLLEGNLTEEEMACEIKKAQELLKGWEFHVNDNSMNSMFEMLEKAGKDRVSFLVNNTNIRWRTYDYFDYEKCKMVPVAFEEIYPKENDYIVEEDDYILNVTNYDGWILDGIYYKHVKKDSERRKYNKIFDEEEGYYCRFVTYEDGSNIQNAKFIRPIQYDEKAREKVYHLKRDQ